MTITIIIFAVLLLVICWVILKYLERRLIVSDFYENLEIGYKFFRYKDNFNPFKEVLTTVTVLRKDKGYVKFEVEEKQGKRVESMSSSDFYDFLYCFNDFSPYL